MRSKDSLINSKTTFLILFALIIFLSYKIAASFLVSVLVGWLVAHALNPLKEARWLKKLKPIHAARLIFVGLLIVVVIPLGFFISSFIQQAMQFKNYLTLHEMNSLQSLVEIVGKWPLATYFIKDPAQFENQITTWTAQLGSAISSIAIDQAAAIPSLLIQTFFILLSSLVFLTDGDKFGLWLSDKIPLKNDLKNSISKSFNYSSKRAVWASLAASGAQSLTVFIGFLVLNVPAAVLATGATFVGSFIPILGATPVWLLGALYLYLQGSTLKGIIMILFGLTTGLVDNYVLVLVLRGPQGLHPLVGLVAVFGGIQVFGILGVLIGPILIALLITMCEVSSQVWED